MCSLKAPVVENIADCEQIAVAVEVLSGLLWKWKCAKWQFNTIPVHYNSEFGIVLIINLYYYANAANTTLCSDSLFFFSRESGGYFVFVFVWRVGT